MKSQKLRKLENIIADKHNNILGLAVIKGNKKVYEKYYNNFSYDSSIHVSSVTKSVFSALIGIAIDKGYIKSIKQRIIEFFPDYRFKKNEKILSKVTIEDILTMRVPYKFQTEPYEKFFPSDDWVKSGLDYIGGEGEIGKFKYSPIIGAHILSGILFNATQENILNFANQNLFNLLGFNIDNNIILKSKEEHINFVNGKKIKGWVVDPKGLNTASWGLTLSLNDMSKIGQLYLNNGIYKGKKIISKKWIKESTSKHIKWNNLKYGYLWWIINDEKNIYAAVGDGGNVIYVNEEKSLVVVIASSFVKDSNDKIKLIEQFIETINF